MYVALTIRDTLSCCVAAKLQDSKYEAVHSPRRISYENTWEGAGAEGRLRVGWGLELNRLFGM